MPISILSLSTQIQFRILRDAVNYLLREVPRDARISWARDKTHSGVQSALILRQNSVSLSFRTNTNYRVSKVCCQDTKNVRSPHACSRFIKPNTKDSPRVYIRIYILFGVAD